MQTFIVGAPWSGLLSRLGRNRLVRASDRLEAIATIALFVVAVAIIPVVTTVASTLYRQQAAMYVQQAEAVHQITARVTEASSTKPGPGMGDVHPTIISWDVNGLPRSGSINWSEPLAVGRQIQVWVDATGKLDHAPVSADHAVADAAVAGVLLWSAGVGVGVGGLRWFVWQLDKRRNARWDDEFRALVDGDGGRANRQ